MKSVNTKELVRKAFIRDGKSKRQIARELNLHRDTVTRLLKMEASEIPRFQRQSWTSPVIGTFVPIIETWLALDEQAPRKQRHTAKRIFDRLRDEYGYPGSERTVRDAVAKLRKKPQEVFLPLAFKPGEMAQADWIEDMRVIIAGVLCEVQVLTLVLNYSGSVYCEAFPNMRQEAFFQGHANAFEFWGGVPQSVTYDNLKSAVQKILQGKNRVENDRFTAFRSAYLFESRFCRPAKGSDKGRVENMVKFTERNFLTPIPQVDSLAELNGLLRQRCRDYLNHTQSRQTETVGARLESEKAHFLALPTHPPECCRIIPVKADKSALVQFETNRYSVPSEAAHKTLWLKAFVDRVEITDAEKTIAQHSRLNGKFQESIRFEHYRKILDRKPGAVEHFRGNSQPLPLRRRPEGSSPYPSVTVQPPDLTKYSQLLRSLHYDPAAGAFTGHPPQEAAPSQHPSPIPQAGLAGR